MALASMQARVSRGRILKSFGIGVLLGLLPKLGVLRIFGGPPLLDYLPTTLEGYIYPNSLLMGVLMAVTQVLLDESRYQGGQTGRRVFYVALGSFALGTLCLTVLNMLFTVQATWGDNRQSTFVIGISRPDTCACNTDEIKDQRTISDSECIQRLSHNPDAIASCWGSSIIRFNRLKIALAYLTTTGSFSVLFAMILGRIFDRSGARRALKVVARKSLEVDGSQCYDVFLAYNSADRKQVKAIYSALKDRGLIPWLDTERIPPGRLFQVAIQQVISEVKAAAIFFGPKGLGAWQAVELRSFISQCVDREIPIIPVLLPGVSELPPDLLFLREFSFIELTSLTDTSGLDQLQWGITGHRSEMSGISAGE